MTEQMPTLETSLAELPKQDWLNAISVIAEDDGYFEQLNERVYGLGERIEGMKMRVDDALTEQRTFLKSIAVGELQAQKQRLDVYTVQARFALAAIYDVAAIEAEKTQ